MMRLAKIGSFRILSLSAYIESALAIW